MATRHFVLIVLIAVVCEIAWGDTGWITGNQCLGSGCHCTRTPVTITCKDGYSDDIPDMIRNAATVVYIKVHEARELTHIDLMTFGNIKELFIELADNEICNWISDKKRSFPDLVIKRLNGDCDPIMGTTTDTSGHAQDKKRDQDSDKPNDVLSEDENMSTEGEGWQIFGFIAMVVIIGVGVYCLLRQIRCVVNVSNNK